MDVLGDRPSAHRITNSGLAIFSKYEIVAQDFVPFKYASHADALAQKPRPFARLRLPGGELVDVYDTHFQAAKDKPHGAVTQTLIDFVRQHDQGHPIFIMGDFNSPDQSEVYKTLVRELGLHDSFREVHPQAPGYTSDGALNPYKDNPESRKRIDYIFYRPGQDLDVHATQSEVAYNRAVDGIFVSDHFGVHTHFELSPQNP